MVIVHGLSYLLKYHLFECVNIPINLNIDHHLLTMVYQQTLYYYRDRFGDVSVRCVHHYVGPLYPRLYYVYILPLLCLGLHLHHLLHHFLHLYLLLFRLLVRGLSNHFHKFLLLGLFVFALLLTFFRVIAITIRVEQIRIEDD